MSECIWLIFFWGGLLLRSFAANNILEGKIFKNSKIMQKKTKEKFNMRTKSSRSNWKQEHVHTHTHTLSHTNLYCCLYFNSIFYFFTDSSFIRFVAFSCLRLSHEFRRHLNANKSLGDKENIEKGMWADKIFVLFTKKIKSQVSGRKSSKINWVY